MKIQLNNIIEKGTLFNLFKTKNLGFTTFIIGVILCVVGVALYLIWKLSFASGSHKISIVVTMIAVGLPLILAGVSAVLKVEKMAYSTVFLSLGIALSLIAIVIFHMYYPENWHYPLIFYAVIPYMIGILSLIVNVFLSAKIEEDERIGIIGEVNRLEKELEEIHERAKEKEEISKEAALYNYIDKFAEGLKERTQLAIQKYQLSNKQLKVDVENYKQRMEEEKVEFKKQANEKIIKKLLDPLDNMDRALNILEQRENEKDEFIKNIIDGIAGTQNDLYKVLESEGVEAIEGVGEEFDPYKQEEVETVIGEQNNIVVEVKEKGYRFKGSKVIRPAKVIVSKKETKE